MLEHVTTCTEHVERRFYGIAGFLHHYQAWFRSRHSEVLVLPVLINEYDITMVRITELYKYRYRLIWQWFNRIRRAGTMHINKAWKCSFLFIVLGENYNLPYSTEWTKDWLEKRLPIAPLPRWISNCLVCR